MAFAVAAVHCQSPDGFEPEGDRDAPNVADTQPEPDAVGVSTQSSVTVAFDEPVNPGSVGPQNFLVSANGDPVPGAIVSDGSGRRFTYVPEDSLPGNRAIEVEVSGVLDQAGNMLPAPYHFGFHTVGSNPIPPRVPSNPYPAHGANGVPIDTTFTWRGGSTTGDDVTYDFWLGRSSSSLERLGNDLTDTQFDPGPLSYATSYVWRVIATSNGGVSQGPLWSFTTVSSPDPNQPPDVPCNPAPVLDANDVPVDVALDWECTGDPDGDDVTYDVYLGTSTDPALVASVPGPPYQPSSALANDTRYYWRIEARDEQGAVSPSPLWHFDTVQAPPPNDPPSAPEPPITPADGSTVIGLTALLTWSGGVDPDGDPVSYLVRFGTSNPPPNLRSVSLRSTLILGL
ncbi:MAG TPA: Ig-like domain-containing protein, partial [Candidatus Udaeobacter sp.]|nr:Ig-like domain-containing protein [Candidatus Udaeobacter sp.]